MTIQQQIKNDLKQAMKQKDPEKINTLRIVMGEFARAESKELADSEVVGVLKKLIKSERESLAHLGQTADSRYIELLKAYLPEMATDEEIRQWVQQHVDFSKYKNKMQAMREIMSHFGSRADGNQVKQVLQDL